MKYAIGLLTTFALVLILITKPTNLFLRNKELATQGTVFSGPRMRQVPLEDCKMYIGRPCRAVV